MRGGETDACDSGHRKGLFAPEQAPGHQPDEPNNLSRGWRHDNDVIEIEESGLPLINVLGGQGLRRLRSGRRKN